MTLDIEPVVDQKNLKPSLTVMGIGGAGSNAVNNMIQSNLNNVDFIVANTDAQALENSLCYNRIQLGLEKTKGLGAGADPIIGKDAAEESIDLISEELRVRLAEEINSTEIKDLNVRGRKEKITVHKIKL